MLADAPVTRRTLATISASKDWPKLCPFQSLKRSVRYIVGLAGSPNQSAVAAFVSGGRVEQGFGPYDPGEEAFDLARFWLQSGGVGQDLDLHPHPLGDEDFKSTADVDDAAEGGIAIHRLDEALRGVAHGGEVALRRQCAQLNLAVACGDMTCDGGNDGPR